MMHPDQQTLDGEKVGEPYRVTITETRKMGSDDPEGHYKESGKLPRTYLPTVKRSEHGAEEAVHAAITEHFATNGDLFDRDDAVELTVKVVRG